MAFWRFLNIAATETEPERTELRIEGDIVDDEDAWLYEWFGIPSVSPNVFRAELEKHAGKNIDLWINSRGGSVWAAAGMYNALMEHKKTGAKITAHSDQKVMSAATIPFCAGDERDMGPVDIFMMHNPLTEVYGYASDLRRVADVLDEVKESIINAYQLATGRSRAKISQLMNDETYMSAKTAIKEGFATAMRGATAETQGVDNIADFSFSRKQVLDSTCEALKRIVAKEGFRNTAPPKTTEPPMPKKPDNKIAIARLALELEL
jgi:ATP-dependent protease ClpP protease subunit